MTIRMSLGSTYYVNSLPAAELARIGLYLNFVGLGSPNHVFFVYDGDDSDAVGAGAGPAGSAAIEKTFEAFYDSRGLPYKGTDLSGLSDYGPFTAAGIPVGGVFTGFSGIKTADEAALWGGVAGLAYDPCNQLACDTYDNVNLDALDVNADAVAWATLQYAMSTQDVNGGRARATSSQRSSRRRRRRSRGWPSPVSHWSNDRHKCAARRALAAVQLEFRAG